LRVSIEVRVELVGLDVQHRDVAVEEQRDPIERRAPSLLGARGQEMTMPQRRVIVGFPSNVPDTPRGLYRGRWIRVIEQRRGSHEPLVSHQLFGV
jgi:hypothetical protein